MVNGSCGRHTRVMHERPTPLPPAARHNVVVFQERNIFDAQRRGATVFTSDTVKALAESYDVTVVSGSSEGKAADFTDENGIRYLQLATPDPASVYEGVRNFVESGQLDKALGGKPVHFALEEANWNPFGTPAWNVDFPISTVIYHVQPHWKHPDGTSSLDAYAASNAHVLDISRFTTGELRQLGVRNVKTLPVALPSGKDVAIGQSGAEPIVVWAGAYSPEKRPELAIEAVAVAAQRIPGLKLRLLGRLPNPNDAAHPYADIQTRYADLVEQGTIEFVDSPSDQEMVKDFASARALLNTSVASCEGFGLVIAEAAYQGSYPIVVPGGGAAEAARLCRGKVAESDDVRAVADAIEASVPQLVAMRQEGKAPTLASPTKSWTEVAAVVANSIESAHGIVGPARMNHVARHSLTAGALQ